MTGGYFKGCCGLGYGDQSAQGMSELFDPATATFSGSGNLNDARYFHTAINTLPGRRILIAGGNGRIVSGPSFIESGGPIGSGELYDPVSGAFSLTGSMNTVRWIHTAALLNNGMVLLAGGNDAAGNPMAGAELYSRSDGSYANPGTDANSHSNACAYARRQLPLPRQLRPIPLARSSARYPPQTISFRHAQARHHQRIQNRRDHQPLGGQGRRS